MSIKTKRVYAPPSPADGKRVLIDRLWPRGLSKERASVDEWFRDLAPSHALRKWFGHKPERWTEFRARYLRELARSDKDERLRQLRSMTRKTTVTLLFASKDEEHNNAAVLLQLFSRKRHAHRNAARS